MNRVYWEILEKYSVIIGKKLLIKKKISSEVKFEWFVFVAVVRGFFFPPIECPGLKVSFMQFIKILLLLSKHIGVPV